MLASILIARRVGRPLSLGDRYIELWYSRAFQLRHRFHRQIPKLLGIALLIMVQLVASDLAFQAGPPPKRYDFRRRWFGRLTSFFVGMRFAVYLVHQMAPVTRKAS